MTNDHKNRSTGGITLTRRQLGQAAVAGGALAAFGRAPAFAQNTTLKVGVLLPRSGLLAQAGQACQRGAEIAPAVLAEMGYKVEVMSADTESNVDVARSRTEKLINDGANVIVGAFDSGQTAAAAQVCEQRGVPLVMNIAAADRLTEQGFKTVFRNFPTSTMLVSNGLALMKDLFAATGTTPKSAVFLHANDTFGMANKQALDALFPTLNMPFTLIESISYDPKAQDLAVEVAKAKATGAELAIVTTRANDAIMLVREMVKQRWEPKGIVSPGSPGLYDEQFYKVLGKYADFAMTNLPWYDPKAAMTKKVEAAFKKQFPNDRFEGYAFNVAFTFEAILIAADAFKRAGSADPASLLAALRETNLTDKMMVGPAIKFDAKGQNTQLVSACIQNHGQRPTVVLPKGSAEHDPVFPAPGWGKRA
ncbi:ABC transporter substrate-binding protein [Azospirillum agricola]|uniref:ABC transporter substrate-binding protein n=1 Tax=Azospirillum agricola TaxID=1720247 RepID=UPI000A0F185B|nr:ABC transporter substrate-binding protein [Azospirillum agricola]MBP2231490.1 branched-chain amino acid transport system substrate-binding protein [Azospirillum agricola]SMH44254.1 amino acid/amide ABC transporter substrate-binding protein, HAAT family [Azospirillum lipoferum]